jgi:hypothetical protein
MSTSPQTYAGLEIDLFPTNGVAYLGMMFTLSLLPYESLIENDKLCTH